MWFWYLMHLLLPGWLFILLLILSVVDLIDKGITWLYEAIS